MCKKRVVVSRGGPRFYYFKTGSQTEGLATGLLKELGCEKILAKNLLTTVFN